PQQHVALTAVDEVIVEREDRGRVAHGRGKPFAIDSVEPRQVDHRQVETVPLAQARRRLDRLGDERRTVRGHHAAAAGGEAHAAPPARDTMSYSATRHSTNG